MTLLSSVWAWIKKSWRLVIGLIIGLLAAFFALREGPVAEGFRALKKIRKDEEELEEKIEDELSSQAEKEKRIDEETQMRLAEIEEKFKEKNQELEQDKKEEVKRIVRETDGNPSELAKRLSKLTGLSVTSNDIE
jgi:DNA anti-recombination protein RmuC